MWKPEVVLPKFHKKSSKCFDFKQWDYSSCKIGRYFGGANFLLKLKPETRSLWLKFWKSIYRLTPDSNHHHSIVISLVSLMNSWWWFLIMYSRCAHGEIANRYNLYGSKSLLIMQVLILNYRSHLLIVTSFVSHFYWHARQRRYFDIGIMQ